jgi:succinoglycan biosynthesis protein ExoM
VTASSQKIASVEVKTFDAVTKTTCQVNVCICTFKRAKLLTQLLTALVNQRTRGLFTFSVVVADNDSMQSARPVVDAFSSRALLPVTYCVEPEQNLALVRNKALENADGDYIVFIDDDEFPADDWLYNLLRSQMENGVAGVLGPVNPSYEGAPPSWVLKGKFFDRPNHATGYKLSWSECRTGNVLFRKSILEGVDMPFRPEFHSAGEDMDFFRRMIDKGCTFIWCRDAIVYEVVPESRCNRTFLLKRALLRGSNFRKHPTDRLKNLLRSLIAVPSYTLALPILLLFGQHLFLKYLVKLCDHASRLLAFAGWSVVKEREM